MSSRRRSATAVLVACVAIGSGCGDGDGDERSPEATIKQFQAAFGTGDFERACAFVTKPAARHVGQAGHQEPSSCPHDLELLALSFRRRRDTRDAPQPRVRSVEVDGDRAVAVLRLGEAAQSHVPLVRQDGEWKVDAVYGDVPGARQRDPF